MSSNDHRWLTPSTYTQSEIFEIYQTTREFYHEAEYREDFDRYCEWYDAAAKANRREFEELRGDINLLGWFRRKRDR